MSWHGSDQEHVALEAAAQGHDVVLTPEESLYFDHYQSALPDEGPGQPPMATLRQAYDTAVIPNGATAAEAKRVIGVQGRSLDGARARLRARPACAVPAHRGVVGTWVVGGERT